MPKLKAGLLALLLAMPLWLSPAASTGNEILYTPPDLSDSSDSSFYSNWLAGPLRFVNEPSLWNSFQQDENLNFYRISKLPSFSSPVVARFHISPDGSTKLFLIDPDINELERLFAQGFETDMLIEKFKNKVVLNFEAGGPVNIPEVFSKARFWTAKIDPLERKDAGPEPSIMDGTSYFIEAARLGKYKMVVRHGCWIEEDLKAMIRDLERLAGSDSLADGCR